MGKPEVTIENTENTAITSSNPITPFKGVVMSSFMIDIRFGKSGF
jgi:hypothetical protein